MNEHILFQMMEYESPLNGWIVWKLQKTDCTESLDVRSCIDSLIYIVWRCAFHLFPYNISAGAVTIFLLVCLCTHFIHKPLHVVNSHQMVPAHNKISLLIHNSRSIWNTTLSYIHKSCHSAAEQFDLYYFYSSKAKFSLCDTLEIRGFSRCYTAGCFSYPSRAQFLVENHSVFEVSFKLHTLHYCIWTTAVAKWKDQITSMSFWIWLNSFLIHFRPHSTDASWIYLEEEQTVSAWVHFHQINTKLHAKIKRLSLQTSTVSDSHCYEPDTLYTKQTPTLAFKWSLLNVAPKFVDLSCSEKHWAVCKINATALSLCSC